MCRSMLVGFVTALLFSAVAQGSTKVSIEKDDFYINGEITFKGSEAQGLILNSRMIQGIFDDYNSSTVHLWAYPDSKKWDPDRNTREFVGNMSAWRDQGLLAFTVGLQGGCPYGYCNSQPWIVTGFKEDGSLDSAYFSRLKSIIEKADDIGMVPIVQFFYPAQIHRINGDDAIYNAIDSAVQWLMNLNKHNFVVEVVNECGSGKYPTMLKCNNLYQVIDHIHNISNHAFPVSASMSPGHIPNDNFISSADFILLHGNGQSPSDITNSINEVKSKSSYKNHVTPIVFNEDDHYNFNSSSNNMKSAVQGHASWGFFDGCSNNEASDYKDGYQCPPTAWGINTNRKGAFFEAVYGYTH